jgi:hypothetical protein
MPQQQPPKLLDQVRQALRATIIPVGLKTLTPTGLSASFSFITNSIPSR